MSAAQKSVHLTGGILRHFRAFSTPEQNPALGVLSTPAHPQVTQALGGWMVTISIFGGPMVERSLYNESQNGEDL